MSKRAQLSSQAEDTIARRVFKEAVANYLKDQDDETDRVMRAQALHVVIGRFSGQGTTTIPEIVEAADQLFRFVKFGAVPNVAIL